jgi:UDP:flavonoid glycosyltransferase YjiC (YdhE family)
MPDHCVEHIGIDQRETSVGIGLELFHIGRKHIPQQIKLARLVDLLATTPHRVIVSKGPQYEQISLREGMWGLELVPQPALLPHVDLAITHGGNNTVTECFHFGKPMVVLPLFWDQHDNAQRVSQIGFGARLRAFEFEDGELLGAIDRLLGDASLRARLAAMSDRLKAAPGTDRAAAQVAGVGRR